MDSFRQKELFSNQLSPIKKKLSLHFFSEKVIFSSIVFFLVLVLIFCLGIEKGKKSVQNSETKPNKNIELKEIKVKAPSFLKVYTIQLATYKSEKYANQELKKLQEYDAWIKKQRNLWVLYAGKFKSPKEAQGVLKKINKKNRYKDALLRKISQ